MKAIGGALAAVGIGSIIKDSISTAMSVEAAIQQIGRLMGQNANEFLQWANTQAAAYNMSKAEAMKYGAVYSNLLSTFTKDTGETMTYTQDLLKASAVVASGTGRTMEDVMERIRSGMLGNTEAIEDLGINVNIAMIESTEAFRKFANGKSWQQLDFQTQQQIRLFAILEQSTKKYGDAVNENTSSRQAQFVAQLKNIQLSLGQAFLPIYNAVLPALTKLAAVLAYIMGIVAQFTQALFGAAKEDQAKATTQQAKAVSGLGDAYKEAGKKAKGALAGFDEINQMQDSSTSGAGGASGSNMPAMPASGDMLGIGAGATEVSAKVQEMANKVKAAFRSMKDAIVTHKDEIIAALAGLASGFATFAIVSNWGAIVGAIRAAFLGVGAAIGGLSLPILGIAALVAALVGGFIYFYRTNEKFRGVVDGVLNAIKEATVMLWQKVLVPMGNFLADVFVKAWEAVTVAAKWLWSDVFVPFGQFLTWFWHNVLVPIGGVLKDVLGVAFQTVASIAKSFWQNVLVPLGSFFTENFQPAVEAISAVFSFLWKEVLAPFGAFVGDVLKVIFKDLTDTIVFLWKQVLKPLAEFVGGNLETTFDTVFKGIGETINGLKTTLTGILNFITGVFTGNWQKAWNGIKTIFEGVWDGITAVVKGAINLMIDAVNLLIRGLNKISFDIPDWVPNIGGNSIGIRIPTIPKLAKGGITNGPTLAMIGDNPGGREVVSPLEDLKDMIASAVGTAVMSAMQFNSGNSKTGDIVLQIDGTTLARVINPYNSKESARIGGAMITTA